MKRFYDDLTVNILSLILVVTFIVDLFLPSGSLAYKITSIVGGLTFVLAIGRTVYCIWKGRKEQEAGIPEPETSSAVEILNAIDVALLFVWIVLMMIMPSDLPTWFYIVAAISCAAIAAGIVIYFRRIKRKETQTR